MDGRKISLRKSNLSWFLHLKIVKRYSRTARKKFNFSNVFFSAWFLGLFMLRTYWFFFSFKAIVIILNLKISSLCHIYSAMSQTAQNLTLCCHRHRKNVILWCRRQRRINFNNDADVSGLYDSQAVTRKHGRLLWEPSFSRRTPIGRMAKIYKKYHHKQGEALTFWVKNCLKQHFYI